MSLVIYEISQMKWVKKAILALLIGTVIWYQYDRMNDGFSVRGIRSSLPYYPEYDLAQVEDHARATSLLDQKFYYKGKGSQFYVFSSEDGKYVLKFFKQKHLRPKYQNFAFLLPKVLKQKVNHSLMIREKRVRELFASCCLAFTHLSEETAIQYLHLHRKKTLGINVVIVDRIGISHTLSIDDFEFVVQERGVEAREVLHHLLEVGDGEGVRVCLKKLLAQIGRRLEKEIRDCDTVFLRNIGFSQDGQRTLLLDIGEFKLDPKAPSLIDQDIALRVMDMRLWATHHHPDLLPYLDEL